MSNTSTDSRIARPYAKAVFEIAKASGAFDRWATMLSIAAQVVSDPKMQVLLKNPLTSTEWCVETIVGVESKAFTNEGHAFLRLVGSRKRWSVLPAIFQLFEAHRALEQGVSVVKIVVAHSLTPAQQAELNQALSRRLEKKLEVTYEMDPSILGGAVIHIGDQRIDGSMRGRLSRLAETLNVG